MAPCQRRGFRAGNAELASGPSGWPRRPGGVIGWEAFTTAARQARPGLPANWCLAIGQPASQLPAGFAVLDECDVGDGRGAKRRLLARWQPG